MPGTRTEEDDSGPAQAARGRPAGPRRGTPDARSDGSPSTHSELGEPDRVGPPGERRQPGLLSGSPAERGSHLPGALLLDFSHEQGERIRQCPRADERKSLKRVNTSIKRPCEPH
jgi:hypothetical protein